MKTNKSQKIDSALYKVLVDKLIKQRKANPSGDTRTISMSKEEIMELIGIDDFNRKLEDECQKIMLIRIENESMVASVFPSVAWNSEVLEVEFGRLVIPYLLEEPAVKLTIAGWFTVKMIPSFCILTKPPLLLLTTLSIALFTT